jgi:hypothetical protein
MVDWQSTAAGEGGAVELTDESQLAMEISRPHDGMRHFLFVASVFLFTLSLFHTWCGQLVTSRTLCGLLIGKMAGPFAHKALMTTSI